MLGRVLILVSVAGVIVSCSRPMAQFSYAEKDYQVLDAVGFENKIGRAHV